MTNYIKYIVLLVLWLGFIAPSIASVSLQDFFEASPNAHFVISPNGQYIAYSESLNAEYNVYVYDSKSQKKHKVHSAKRYTTETIKTEFYIKWVKHNNRIYGLTWLGDNTLAIKEYTKDGFRRYKVLKLDIDDDLIVEKNVNYLNQRGYWLNPLVGTDKFALFAKYKKNDDFDNHIDIFKLNLKKSNLDGQTSNKKRFNKKGAKLQYWITDTKGHRVAGTRTIDGKPELYIRTGNKPKRYRWPLMWTGKKDTYIKPILLNEDEQLLYVITNNESDKKVLQAFDLKTQQFTDIIYSHDQYDITNGLSSADKTKLIGVSYIDGGYYKQVFFDKSDEEKQQKLRKITQSTNVYVIDRAVENNNGIYKVSSSDNSGEVFFYDAQSEEFNSLLTMKPWLKEANLKKTELIQVKTKDNTELEAFLTLPEIKTNIVPLVVIPHGGPIGVSDSRHYSAETQVLVNSGFATLQVNFRGSAGYGKAFKNQGMGQWGELIEDDIESALEYVKQHFPINPERVCIIGGSYGGYSAIYSLIRSPHLYQCGASFAGVTDLALMFQRSDIENNEVVKMFLAKSAGDPDINQKQLFRQSPVYRANELTRPLFIAHGTDDDVVDIEHAYRLKFALKANKKPFEWQVLDGVGHGFGTTKQAELYYSKLLTFLNKHLKSE
ncbi:MAG: prolyl oligopeptidase family serine peptidase [Colwellia sp.]|nr:prolyl oligopeptidase family serine peptidase [Colwellia sp.]MCW9081312.1 prolyl oligopeptidase family serine peptidase [Colwellia sp.]